MSFITLDCPHCFKRDIQVEIVGAKHLKKPSKKQTFSLVGFCTECEEGIALNAEPNSELNSDILTHPHLNQLLSVTKTFPTFPESKYLEQLSIPDIEILLEYKSSKGEVSSRRVRVKSMEYKTKNKSVIATKLHCYCLEKKMARDFNVSRIINAYDAETGEIISDIPKYLMQ
ncbi:hypothetical protein HK18_01390 [Commensalibacter intestini]|uniref:CpXC domain-containing protein n=1 Tax=Commensalibacter intestini TaxID=479936 RepID=A0A251ZT25_9PROT|nr:hypothetical protein HK18_01390 [Commensalibacter intestini]